MRNLRPIMLVEDDVVDAMAVNRALQDLEVPNELVCVNNGEEALNYLQDNGNEKPGIILLDLNMPRMNGIELLKAVKNNESLKRIPVIVLTTSSAEQDINESFAMSVAGYMVKPVDYKDFLDLIKTIDNYWTLNQLPT